MLESGHSGTMEKHFIRENNNSVVQNWQISSELKSDKVENLIKLYTSPNFSPLEQITELDLSNSNLSDITCSLDTLPLKKLNISENNLIDVPRCFYLGLDHLEYLDISKNKLKLFEVEPNCCKTLKVLNLCSNNFKDIPQWIMNHRTTSLKELHYDFNKITTLRCIFGITMNFSVPKLSLRNCILRDEDCAFLKNCRYLEELDIGNADGVSINLNSIRTIDKLLYQPNWKYLSVLKLNNSSLSVYPDGLNWLEGLTELHLSNNHFTWLPKEGLEYLVNLEVLNLSRNFIVYLPEKLNWLVHLKVLNLSYNRLETPFNYSNMNGLEVLDLYDNRLENLEQHSIPKNLKCLDVEMNYMNFTECDLLGYSEMKDKLRARIPEEVRENGVTTLGMMNNWELQTSYDSDDGSYISDTAEEDWDEELKIREQITPSDDEWNGEHPFLPYVPRNTFEKPSVYNDDVIFCDAD